MFHVFKIIYYTFLLFLNYFHTVSSNSLVISLVLLGPKKILLTYIIFSTIYLFIYFFLFLNFTLRNKINQSFTILSSLQKCKGTRYPKGNPFLTVLARLCFTKIEGGVFADIPC